MKTPKQRAHTITEMMDYGFFGYKKLELFKQNQEVVNLNVWLGSKQEVSAIVLKDIAVNVPSYYSLNDLDVTVKYTDPIYAPIKKDSKIASLHIEIKGFKKYEFDLFAKEPIEKVGYIRKVSIIAKYKFKKFFNKYFS